MGGQGVRSESSRLASLRAVASPGLVEVMYVTVPSPLQEIVGDLTREQTPKNLYLVRGKLYELLVNCIPPEVGAACGRSLRVCEYLFALAL